MQSPPQGAQAAASPKSANATSGGAPEIPPMYSPAQMRQLKFAVIAMGVILLLGFAVVIGRIVYLVNSAPRPAASAAATPARVGAPHQVPSAQLPLAQSQLPQSGVTLSLPRGAVIRQLALSGNRLAIYFEGPDGAGIRIVDLATGGPGLTLPITPEPERRP